MKREEKQLDFLNTNFTNIFVEFEKNINKIGYLQVFVNDEFGLSSINFIEGDFNKEQFTLLNFNNENKINDSITIKDAVYMYVEILWFDNKTKWFVKQLILSGDLKL
jgi:hypothetical protein